MSETVLRVKIVSPRNLIAQMPAGERYGYGMEAVDEDPDVVILDIRSFPDAMDMANERQAFSVPALMAVRNRKELEDLFPRLLPGDDICLLREFRAVSTFRAIRLYNEGEEKPPMEFYRRMLTVDHMTGLLNRRGLDEILQQWSVGVSATNPLSAIILDLDHFKAVNDSFGHQAGDRVLKDVAAILKPHISDEIRVCRYGGEEMVVLMKADNRRACRFAEFLRKEIETNVSTPQDLDGLPVRAVTASFGVATAREEREVAETLIRSADELVYRAKAEGRNRVEGQEIQDDEDAGLMDEDAVLRDFESRLRVTTDRLVEYLSLRGRKLAGHYRKEADRDGMTGLYRKEYFTRRFAREFENAKKDGRPLTLLFLDIDDFGNVNRTYGYPTGDSTLKKVSGVMLDAVRSVDWTARYGGEELCIIMPVTPLEEARHVAERIRSRVEGMKITAYDGREFNVTVSIGLAEASSSDEEPVDLIQRAGDKTREAKKAGKNAIRS